MDRASTITAVGGMLGDLAADVTEATWDVVLARSVIPDTAERMPGTAGYVDSYDPDWAAAELVSTLFDQTLATGVVTKWSSEGTTMEATPAALAELEQRLRSRSVIAKYAAPDSFGVAVAPGGFDQPPYGPRSQSGRRGVIGNW